MNIIQRLKESEKGIKYALIIYLIIVLADVVSTLFSWKLLEYLEANPLFKYGGIPLVILINLIVVWVIFRMYSNTENTNLRFYLMFILVTVSVTRMFAVYNNILVAMNPPTIQMLQAIGTEQLNQMKKQAIIQLMLINTIPFVNCAITWILFRKDHEVKIWKKKKKTTHHHLKEATKSLVKALFSHWKK